MKEVEIKLVDDTLPVPQYQTEGAVAFDLYSRIDVEIKPKTPSQPPKPKLTPAGQASTRAANRQLQPYKTYVVKKGDTLWSIAKKYNVDVEKLKYLNGLRGTALPPGKVLRIPH